MPFTGTCDDLKSWEVLSEDCLSAESASSAAPNFLKQRRKQAVGGALFFGYFLLSKQKKVTRLKAKNNIRSQPCKLYLQGNLLINAFAISNAPFSELLGFVVFR